MTRGVLSLFYAYAAAGQVAILALEKDNSVAQLQRVVIPSSTIGSHVSSGTYRSMMGYGLHDQRPGFSTSTRSSSSFVGECPACMLDTRLLLFTDEL